ncbi:hypothetical protein FQR65_LT15585 [Abscondita terminalis]|nr:hypothetical protein FQR65_LT15585 [Abscondita terminalis]
MPCNSKQYVHVLPLVDAPSEITQKFLLEKSKILLTTETSSSNNFDYELHSQSIRVNSDFDSFILSDTPGTSSNIVCVDTASTTSAKGISSENTLCTKIPRCKLLNQLNSCNEGKEILAHYNIHGHLKRRLLVKLLIDKELEEDPDKRIPRQRFLQLAQDIRQIFQEEEECTYYIPPKRDYNGKPISAHGKLWDRYINTRTKYRNLSLIKRKSKDVEIIDVIDLIDQEENIQRHIFLKHNNQPWTTVIEYWKSTTFIRQRQYKESNTQTHDYFKLYPPLSLPSGHSLISMDFNNIYPNYENKLFFGWSAIFKNIINIAKKKSCPIIQLLNNFQEKKENLEIKERDAFDENSSFLLFPLLFPNTSRQKKRSSVGKYSKVEIQNSFVTHVEHEEDLNVIFEQREARLRLLKATEQPSVYFIGELQNPRAILKINEVIYELETPVKAVDTCFKAFFVLNANYPEKSVQIWTYIQTKIYGLLTDFDTHFNGVTKTTCYFEDTNENRSLLNLPIEVLSSEDIPCSSSESNSQEATTSKWIHESILLLINQFELNTNLLQSPKRSNKSVWGIIANIMNSKGYNNPLSVYDNETPSTSRLPESVDLNLDVEVDKLIPPFRLSGRRIVDIEYFYKELVNLGNHSKLFSCSLENMIPVKEVRHGLTSCITLKCNMCHFIAPLWTTNKSDPHLLDVNTSAVVGIMGIGTGFSHLEQFCSCLAIPTMSCYELPRLAVRKSRESV